MNYVYNLGNNSAVKEISSKVFAQYGFIKTYCSSEKLSEWKNAQDKNGKPKKLTAEERWVEIFKYMDAQQVPYLEFARLIEFILCLPGTNAPVERVFSSAKNIWKVESSQLAVKTLKSILSVKMNLDYSCVEFYHFLKKTPVLLRQIASQDKYDFKQPAISTQPATSTQPEANISLMSIETADNNDEETENL